MFSKVLPSFVFLAPVLLPLLVHTKPQQSSTKTTEKLSDIILNTSSSPKSLGDHGFGLEECVEFWKKHPHPTGLIPPPKCRLRYIKLTPFCRLQLLEGWASLSTYRRQTLVGDVHNDADPLTVVTILDRTWRLPDAFSSFNNFTSIVHIDGANVEEAEEKEKRKKAGEEVAKKLTKEDSAVEKDDDEWITAESSTFMDIYIGENKYTKDDARIWWLHPQQIIGSNNETKRAAFLREIEEDGVVSVWAPPGSDLFLQPSFDRRRPPVLRLRYTKKRCPMARYDSFIYPPPFEVKD